MTTASYDVDELRTAYPEWSFFYSDEGVLYATRRGVRLQDAEIHKGLHQTVSANDAATVVDLLQDQERVAAMS
ncbi:hypothetical protein SAMN05444920_104426 [Nonomuraea solani]|uniref:Uncharacterized protein n=1 Tax=Nonomuraea solani TaxID=1144553 RepID=A0A1H6CWF7_9ACTN|nr:hypothetical protein [Nonomuraea solani]SEG76875.1 hypothetical protein SAMN05444920_104426 [Nonomuraea solani]